MDDKKDLKKVLNKLEIEYEELTPKEIAMLELANDWIINKFEESKKTISSIQKYKYSIQDFCKECGINRATLYKKNLQGENAYKVVIQYLNSKSIEYKDLTEKLFETQRKETKDIKDKIDKLVARDVEYMNLQEQLRRLEIKIKSLEKENRELIKKQKMS